MNKVIIKNILLFIFFFLCISIFYSNLNIDVLYNYSFSYGLFHGQVPYNEFNLIIPLFGPFIYSLLFFINDSISIMYLEQAFFLTILFNIFNHYMGKNKSLLLLCLFLIPFVFYNTYILFPGYNFLIYFFFVLLVFLEKNNSSDRVIGLILGLCIITKHNIGIMFFIVSFILYYKDYKKLLIRIFYACIPIIIFIFYLLFNNCLNNFIDYCLLGLFNFGESNFKFNNTLLIISILIIIYSLISYLKYKNNNYLYLFFYGFVVYPVCDNYHVSFFINAFIFIFILNYNFKYIFKFKIILYLLIIFIPITYCLLGISITNKVHLYHYNNLSYVFRREDTYYKEMGIIDYCSNKDCIYLTDYFNTVITNGKLNNYLNFNKGNFGYKGNINIIDKLNKEHNKYLIINDYLFDKTDYFSQLDQEIIYYIRDNYKYYDYKYNYYIYYKE